MLEQFGQVLLSPLVLWSSALALLLVYYLSNRPKNLPPGPWGLPIVGYAPFLSSNLHWKLKALAETHGDVLCLNVFGKKIIVLSSYEAVREAFSVKGDEFAGRPQEDVFLQWIVDGLGILQAEGHVWKEHRRFALHTLRDFGFGKLSLEQRVQEITDDLIKALDDTKGKPYNLENDLSISATNVICSMMFDKHYEKDDQDFLFIREVVKTMLGYLGGASFFLDTALFKFLPKCFNPGFSKLETVKKGMHELINRIIQEHEEKFDPENLRDYVDVYLQERKTAEKEGRLEESSFSIARLRGIALNLFMAGAETTTTTLTWAVKLMAFYPDVQKAIQTELDQVIGRERRPSTLDRPSLPYTEACIMEIHRYASMLINSPPHSNPEEATLCGFTIPKRSLILQNNFAINRDQRHYVNPEEFNPNRFLGPDGKVIKTDCLIPFSIGKRSCLGESLARMEVFLFLTSLLQRFSFEFPEGVEPNLDYIASFIRKLKPYELCIKSRYLSEDL